MNRKQLVKVLYIAEHTNFGDRFAEMSGILADRIHNSSLWGSVLTSAMDIAALFKWQGLRFDGNWDMAGVEECFEWVKREISIIDLDERYNEVKQTVEIKKSRGLDDIQFHFQQQQAGGESRFKLVETK